jgi:4-hydroxy-2-oxoheptanedioate aldolase
MAPGNPMLECMQSGRTALGVWANDSETVELCAFLGLDWIMIDMMFTGMDIRPWLKTQPHLLGIHCRRRRR